MIPQISLNAFSRILYVIFTDLNQPFTFKQCLSAVRVYYPACTKKVLRFHMKEMLQKKYLKKQRVKWNVFYTCLIDKNHIPVNQTPEKPSQRLHFFMCEL